MFKLTVACMTLVLMINGVTKLDKLTNEYLCKSIKLSSLASAIRDNQLRWFFDEVKNVPPAHQLSGIEY